MTDCFPKFTILSDRKHFLIDASEHRGDEFDPVPTVRSLSQLKMDANALRGCQAALGRDDENSYLAIHTRWIADEIDNVVAKAEKPLDAEVEDE